jgi:hypothetical protein
MPICPSVASASDASPSVARFPSPKRQLSSITPVKPASTSSTQPSGTAPERQRRSWAAGFARGGSARVMWSWRRRYVHRSCLRGSSSRSMNPSFRRCARTSADLLHPGGETTTGSLAASRRSHRTRCNPFGTGVGAAPARCGHGTRGRAETGPCGPSASGPGVRSPRVARRVAAERRTPVSLVDRTNARERRASHRRGPWLCGRAGTCMVSRHVRSGYSPPQDVDQNQERAWQVEGILHRQSGARGRPALLVEPLPPLASRHRIPGEGPFADPVVPGQAPGLA